MVARPVIDVAGRATKGGRMYGYLSSEPGLWTVGFYDPDGNWHAESDHESTEKAAERVNYLNGGRIERLTEKEKHHRRKSEKQN